MNCNEIVKHSCLRHIGEMSLYIYLIGQMVVVREWGSHDVNQWRHQAHFWRVLLYDHDTTVVNFDP